MKIELTYTSDSHRLLLIFAGWGMDPQPFRHLTANGYDIAVAFDHRSAECADIINLLPRYSEICLLAWSFGVAAAAHFLRNQPELPITAKAAVNGTLFPVDDTKGIPRAIFDGTMNGLNERTLAKFDRRMCGSAERLSAYNAMHPRRDINELADELKAIDTLPAASQMDDTFDIVYIGTSDHIIPTANQQNAWSSHPCVKTIDSPHLPDFDHIISSMLTDKGLVAGRFGRSKTSYDDEAIAQRRIASHLAELTVSAIDGKDPINMLEVGTGTGMLTSALLERITPNALTLWDLTEIPRHLPGKHVTCDAETKIREIPERSLDLIVSSSAIQWFNSPSSFIHQCHRTLASGGLLALSTFSPENFHELQPYLPSQPEYYDAATWRRILSRDNWKEINISTGRIELQFTSSRELIEHLRRTGVNAITPSAQSLTPLRHILADQVTSLTYSPLYILARR